MQWGPDADAKLFMHVLKIHNVKLDFTALALAMGNDVTPKALTHRIAKLRSMAEDASTPAAGASPGLGLPQPNKRTPAKRAPRTPTTPTPGNKKVATGANKTPVAAGTKRTAAGTAKNGNGNAKANGGGSPLHHVIAAYDGDEGREDAEVEEESVEPETPNKKVKSTSAGTGKGATVDSADEYA